MGQRASKRPQKADKTETRPTRTTSVHSYSINESCSYHINTPGVKNFKPLCITAPEKRKYVGQKYVQTTNTKNGK